MPRYAKLILGVVSVFVLIVVICVVFFATFNWNHARPWVNNQLSELVDRPVQIQGDLSVQWSRPAELKGWRSWVPWPTIRARQITMENAAWSSMEGPMASIDSLALQINPLALADHKVELAEVDIHDAKVLLQRDSPEQNNWTFAKDNNNNQTPSKWTFSVQKVSLDRAAIHLVDTTRNLDIEAALDTLDQPTDEGYGVQWKASGSYNDADFTGGGQAGQVLSLQDGAEPFPLQGEIAVGETVIGVRGSFTRPQALGSLDVQLMLAGASMADLYPILGVVLPNTPPYKTEGRLIAMLEGEEHIWRYEDFQGVVGESDLNGTLIYHQREPRPLLTGKVESKQLRFQDLGPLIGADTSDSKLQGTSNVDVKRPKDKALPVAKISSDSWGVMDADVEFRGRRILHAKDLPLDNITAHVRLQDQVLLLDPLNFGVAGGTLSNTISLDGRPESIKAKVDTSARNLQLKKLFPGAESMDASFGALHGNASLTGQGNSVAQLLGHANGEIKAVISKGTISQFLLEAAGLNVANMVIVKLFGDEQVLLNCMVSDFSVTDGLMQTRVFTLETEDAIVDVAGQINLATEKIDLDIKPENKTVRIFTLRSPLYVRGTFMDPDVGVHTGPLAVRAGAAIALGVVATPLAALLPLLNVGTGDDHDCGRLLSQASESPEAPEPGETRESDLEDIKANVEKNEDGSVKRITGEVEGVAAQ